ncbi:MAG: hypothetical protein M3R24_16780 [Chloroflexota bacterium]|nr:hypothetical protein [Chloroflexota bacterium]
MPIHASKRAWVFETVATGYAIGFNQSGLLTHRYWGKRLPRIEDYPRKPG